MLYPKACSFISKPILALHSYLYGTVLLKYTYIYIHAYINTCFVLISVKRRLVWTDCKTGSVWSTPVLCILVLTVLFCDSQWDNAQAYVVLGLLELQSALKDKEHQRELRQNAYEYFTLARQSSSSCAVALNHLANQLSFRWIALSQYKCSVQDKSHIRITCPVAGISGVEQSASKAIVAGDTLRINKKFVLWVSEISEAVADGESGLSSVVTCDVPEELLSHVPVTENGDGVPLSPITSLELKQTNLVRTLASEAYRSTGVNQVKAESCYLIGRVHHQGGKVEMAARFYEQSKMLVLSVYGLGQLLMSEQNYQEAIDMFNVVLRTHPEDKDTQAFLAMTKCLMTGEILPMDKLKEVCTGFVWEADLWILQGRERLKIPAERSSALKCLENGLACCEAQQLLVDPNLLSNIAMLHHYSGSGGGGTGTGSGQLLSMKFMRRALKTAHVHNLHLNDPATLPPPSLNIKCVDNDVFYSWSAVICHVVIGDEVSDGVEESKSNGETPTLLSGRTRHIRAVVSEDSVCADLTSLFAAGHHVLLGGDVLCEIEEVGSGAFSGVSLVPLPVGTHVSLQHKVYHRNFNTETVTMVYDYARILEDSGKTLAAQELYAEILKLHPSFLECEFAFPTPANLSPLLPS